MIKLARYNYSMINKFETSKENNTFSRTFNSVPWYYFRDDREPETNETTLSMNNTVVTPEESDYTDVVILPDSNRFAQLLYAFFLYEIKGFL